jgi:ribosomal protein L40E
MNLADGIRKIGFRRWYERQLIECHLYLVTGLLGMVVVGACIEEFSLSASWVRSFLIVLLSAAGLAACVWSFRRYIGMLVATQRAAERSVCRECHTYGRLDLLRAGSAPPEIEPDPWLRVRCRKCGHEWIIDS